MLSAINIVLFQIGWFASVIGAAASLPWVGPVAVLIAVAVHLRTAHRPFEEALLVLACGLIGAVFDSFLVAMGWVRYSSGLFSAYVAPYWIITMWMLFATTLNVSMRWLHRKPLLSAVFGFVGAPSSYVAGQKLGGIELTDPFAALLTLAVGWAIILPALVWLAENLDGMPGSRRKWVREQI